MVIKYKDYEGNTRTVTGKETATGKYIFRVATSEGERKITARTKKEALEKIAELVKTNTKPKEKVNNIRDLLNLYICGLEEDKDLNCLKESTKQKKRRLCWQLMLEIGDYKINDSLKEKVVKKLEGDRGEKRLAYNTVSMVNTLKHAVFYAKGKVKVCAHLMEITGIDIKKERFKKVFTEGEREEWEGFIHSPPRGKKQAEILAEMRLKAFLFTLLKADISVLEALKLKREDVKKSMLIIQAYEVNQKGSGKELGRTEYFKARKAKVDGNIEVITNYIKECEKWERVRGYKKNVFLFSAINGEHIRKEAKGKSYGRLNALENRMRYAMLYVYHKKAKTEGLKNFERNSVFEVFVNTRKAIKGKDRSKKLIHGSGKA